MAESSPADAAAKWPRAQNMMIARKIIFEFVFKGV
jgi:hypothetical protein